MPQGYGHIPLQRAVHPLIGHHFALVGQHEMGSCAKSMAHRLVEDKGATSGLGLATALLLAERGAEVVMLGSDAELRFDV